MATASNMATEQTALTEDSKDDSDDEDKNNVDLGVAGLPQVNFSESKNEFETINLDGDGDDEEEADPSDRDLSDDKRKKKYRKKKKRSQPLEDSSESSSDDDRKTCRKKKEPEVNPVKKNLNLTYFQISYSNSDPTSIELNFNFKYVVRVTSA